MLGAPLLMRRALGAAIGIERPVHPILNEAVAENGARMIEHDRISLAIGRPQNPADHLPKQTHFFRGPGENAAADFGRIPAFS